MHLLAACAVIVTLAYIFGKRVVGAVLITLGILAAIIVARAPAFAPDPPEKPREIDQACVNKSMADTPAAAHYHPALLEAQILCQKY